MILNGAGGSGKSTLIRMLENMIGTDNLSHVSLKELSQRFASVGLLGKLLNSCADLEVSALEDTSVIKKVLGEDTLRGEFKGKDSISFKNYSKLIFSTNELPLILSERTNGFYRRLMILNMDKQPEHKRPDYLDILQRETGYLIQLAVRALERMYQSGGVLFESQGSKEAVMALRCDSDTVEAFLQSQTKKVNGEKVDRFQLFRAYEQFCQVSDRQSLTRNNFYRSMRTKGFREKRSADGRYFMDIMISVSYSGRSVKKSDVRMTQEGFLPIVGDEQTSLPFAE
jgi:putative DNA primase/helicase